MNQPKITKEMYKSAALWLKFTREVGSDPNYTQLGLALAEEDPNRPEGEIEYYLVLADNLKTIIDAKFFVVFDGEYYLTSTDTVEGVYAAFRKHSPYSVYLAVRHYGYSVWCEGKNVSPQIVMAGYLT
jgi:hypothetical protein